MNKPPETNTAKVHLLELAREGDIKYMHKIHDIASEANKVMEKYVKLTMELRAEIVELRKQVDQLKA